MIEVHHLQLCLTDFQYTFEPPLRYQKRKDSEDSPVKKRRLGESELVIEDDAEEMRSFGADRSSMCHFLPPCENKKKDGYFAQRRTRTIFLSKFGEKTTRLCRVSDLKGKQEALDLRDLLACHLAESGNKPCTPVRVCKKFNKQVSSIFVHSGVIRANNSYPFCSVDCVMTWASIIKDVTWKNQVQAWEHYQSKLFFHKAMRPSYKIMFFKDKVASLLHFNK